MIESAFFILCFIAIILAAFITLKNHNAFLRDSSTWEHVTPTKPGYITNIATGKSRKLTEEEIDDFRKRE